MARHVALLRAINVGGHVVKMDALRAHCEQCGLTAVETFIASGNVIFESRAPAATLERTLERRLRASLGYDVATFIRSVPELARVVETAAAMREGAENVYVGFLKALPTADGRQAVMALAGPDERFVFAGREIYWFRDGGFSDSKFSGAVLERVIRSPATFRNVTTVTKLAAKYAER